MSDQHRPLMTRHGTHCICGVFCGSGRDVESWRRHSRDRVLLDGTVVGMNLSPISEEWWAVMQGFRRIGQAYVNAGQKLAQALAPLTRDSFTKIDGGEGS